LSGKFSDFQEIFVDIKFSEFVRKFVRTQIFSPISTGNVKSVVTEMIVHLSKVLEIGGSNTMTFKAQINVLLIHGGFYNEDKCFI
jgi:hypothetical protein